MHMNLNMKPNLQLNMENLTPMKKRLLYIIPPVIVAALFIFYFIVPAISERSRLVQELEKQKGDIMIARQKTAKLSTLMAENDKLKSAIDTLQLQLPQEKEISSLLRQVSDVGLGSGLQVLTWKPKERSLHASKEVTEIPVEVEMLGSFHRYGQFLSAIAKLQRIINIPDFTMKVSSKRYLKSEQPLTISFTTLTYSLLSNEEKKALEKAEKEKNKDKNKDKETATNTKPSEQEKKK